MEGTRRFRRGYGRVASAASSSLRLVALMKAVIGGVADPFTTVDIPWSTNRCSDFDMSNFTEHAMSCGSPLSSPCFDFSRCRDSPTVYIYDSEVSNSIQSPSAMFRSFCQDCSYVGFVATASRNNAERTRVCLALDVMQQMLENHLHRSDVPRVLTRVGRGTRASVGAAGGRNVDHKAPPDLGLFMRVSGGHLPCALPFSSALLLIAAKSTSPGAGCLRSSGGQRKRRECWPKLTKVPVFSSM